MNEDFVPYELAVKLKEKGFREKCLYRYRNYSKTLHPNQVETEFARKIEYSEFFKCYNSYIDNDVDAPTISQVLKWLREEKKIFIDIRTSIDLNGKEHFSYYIIHNKVSIREGYTDFDWKFELAALAGVNYCLDNLI